MRCRYLSALPLVAAVLVLVVPSPALADGKLFAPRSYAGSLEERSQEAIIIFTHDKNTENSGYEHLILKLTVEGEVDHFAWVVPFPSEPKVEKEEGAVFAELFHYVQARSASQAANSGFKGEKTAAAPEAKAVEVLSRQIVGSYDVAVVRENQSGALNDWLKAEDFRPLDGGEDVVEFYRAKGYVFACMKVSDTALATKKSVDLHPLRFSFSTGGYDGIYFPMKLTGLQERDFLVNLYVFYQAWLNDRINAFGYEERGLRRVFRDFDGPDCIANAGKRWDTPEADPYLRPYAGRLASTAKLLTSLHPEQKFYLTNIQGQFQPAAVRKWKDDLWLFPYYTDAYMAPYDARPGGPAAANYSEVSLDGDGLLARPWWRHEAAKIGGVFVLGLAVGAILLSLARRFRRKAGGVS